MNKEELARTIQSWDSKKQCAGLVQWVLNHDGYNVGNVDGIIGNQTRMAMTAWETNVPAPFAELVNQYYDWAEERQIVAVAQRLLQLNNISVGAIDGYIGQMTQYGIDVFVQTQLGDTTATTWRNAQEPPNERDEAAMNDFYGVPGTNHVQLILPYSMRIAWNKSQIINRFKINKQCAESAHLIFTEIARNYDIDQIQYHGFDLFGGCFNHRQIRGGTRLSVHSWAASIDLDPERNQLKWGRDRAYFLKTPDCKRFMDIWYDYGWHNLGRERNYDAMHFQHGSRK